MLTTTVNTQQTSRTLDDTEDSTSWRRLLRQFRALLFDLQRNIWESRQLTTSSQSVSIHFVDNVLDSANEHMAVTGLDCIHHE